MSAAEMKTKRKFIAAEVKQVQYGKKNIKKCISILKMRNLCFLIEDVLFGLI